jgi:hypothetical protein
MKAQKLVTRFVGQDELPIYHNWLKPYLKIGWQIAKVQTVSAKYGCYITVVLEMSKEWQDNADEVTEKAGLK